MAQITLPMETSVLIPTNDIVETIPDNEFDVSRHHRGATSYYPKMMLKVILYAYTLYSQVLFFRISPMNLFLD